MAQHHSVLQSFDGAVTEINAECYYALESAAVCAAIIGENDTWKRFSEEATSYAKRFGAALSADTTAFVLNYDQIELPGQLYGR